MLSIFKRKLCYFTFICLLSGCATSNSAIKKFVRDFYDSTLLTRIGIASDEEVKPYLSKDLRKLFIDAKIRQEQFIKQQPNLKPDLVDTLLFTSMPHDLAYKTFIEEVSKVNNMYQVTVSFHAIQEDYKCTDKLFIITNEFNFQVTDIELGCYGPKRLTELLLDTIRDNQ
ncbi:hypothetical protein H0A36_15465 [Endozoicomonas sp. SM1973]|uniref:Lipoprotein n=1 Tax=Spartinivicinus marinus TaxID=2994442 RepID=A0A853IE10_9GAMM|nr:hypothetical protein [Spartinivicinus marinus]MCX4028471.1 hypothetical protein [Spartinivicinus marinus]NYZ67415.1 hypothetical protein [Spartinivicinus marinus]